MNRKLPPYMIQRTHKMKNGKLSITYYAHVLNSAGKRPKIALGKDFDEACYKLRQLLSEIDTNIDRVYAADVLLKQWCKVYLELVKKKRSLERDERSCLHLKRIFGGDLALRKITRAPIMIYRNRRLEEGVKDSTVNRELKCLQHMLNIAKEEGHIRSVPTIKFESEQANARDRIYTEQEYRALLAAAPRYLQRCLIGYWETAMRENELLKLTWPRVDRAAKVIRLLPEDTKEKDTRFIPITDNLAAVLDELWAEYQKTPNLERRVFTQDAGKSRRKGRPIKSLKTVWEKTRDRAGVSNAWIHDFRHTTITRWESEGYPSGLIMKITGHKTFSQHKRYLNLREAPVLRAFFTQQKANQLRAEIVIEEAKNVNMVCTRDAVEGKTGENSQ